ncbi:MAG: ABC transporter ATP-binding protein [Spirochaetaceae bacterium]|nr:ABC transporter ATP-binding protein [Spirochaetaceae bacterium]
MSSAVTNNLLEADGLCLQFGGLTVLDEVSLRVPEGGVTAIIGPNGAGKTSLFNSVSGSYRPHAGRIVFAGADITRLPAARRAALGVARTFQNIALFPSMTVLDNVKLGRHVHLRSGLLAGGLYLGRARREERRLEAYIEDEVADLLGIREILGESGAALPYGLRKRVELARAIAMEPRLLLLDEPAAGLGHGDRERMMRLIRDLQRLRGITVLLVEHDMHVVMDLADQVVVLDFGRVIAAGTPEQVRDDPAVIAAYLGAEAEQAS